ncbi:MAG: 16S rRNA (cytidine(1402)-2'-O)-methyltransferase [Myxococcota bacterium]
MAERREPSATSTEPREGSDGEGVLRIVATPIGNLEDITLRALRVLAEADLVLAEDTRRTRVLLERHGVTARPVSLHAHNEASRIARTLEVLAAGGSVVLVSDAGTPLVSDPGERLAAAAVEAGVRVESVPGASAVTAALAGAGLPSTPFAFLGFPPRKRGAREALFDAYRGRPETLVLFESPRRLGSTLAELAARLGPRRACVARELTKRHEEWVRGSLDELARRFSEGARGEITLVVAGASEAEEAACEGASSVDVDRAVRELVAEGHSPKEIAARLAPETGLRKRDLYARALAARDEA